MDIPIIGKRSLFTKTSGELQKIENTSRETKISLTEHTDDYSGNDNLTKGSQLHRLLVMHAPSDWLLCLFVGGLSLGFNLYRLGSPSLWFEEVLSVERATQPLPVLWHIIFNIQQNMALYYLLLHFWLLFTTLLGLHSTEFIVRLPSAVFAALSSIMVFLLGRRFTGIIGSILGACLYVLNTQQLVYAQETRAYSLQLLLICISWYALFTALAGTHQKRWWACYIGAMTLSIYAQLFSMLILLAQVITFAGLLFLPGLWGEKTQRQLFAFIMSLCSIAVLTTPILLAVRHGSKTDWLPIPHPIDIYYLFLTMSSNSTTYLFIIVLCCLFVVSMALSYVRSPIRNAFPLINWTRTQALILALLCWIVLPVAVSYLVSQKSVHLFSSRYLVTIVPPIVLLVGLSTAFLRGKTVGSRCMKLLLTSCLLLLALHHVPQYYKNAQVEDWRSPALWLEKHYQVGDGLVCYNNAQGCQVSIEYYFYAYPTRAHFTADSPGAVPWHSSDMTNHPGDVEAAIDPTALAAYGAKHPRLFFIIGRLANRADATRAQVAQDWLDAHYRLLAQTALSTVSIHLYRT
jgi:mannosyltransferase